MHIKEIYVTQKDTRIIADFNKMQIFEEKKKEAF